jgi:hypothetical protein
MMSVTSVSHSVPATAGFAVNTSTVLVVCLLRAVSTETSVLSGRFSAHAVTASFSRVG